jgi:hypothetical protein
VRLELQEKAVMAEREGVPHAGSALVQLQVDVEEMSTSKQKIEGQCRAVVDSAEALLRRGLQCVGESEQGEKIALRLAELRELRGKFHWLCAT